MAGVSRMCSVNQRFQFALAFNVFAGHKQKINVSFFLSNARGGTMTRDKR